MAKRKDGKEARYTDMSWTPKQVKTGRKEE